MSVHMTRRSALAGVSGLLGTTGFLSGSAQGQAAGSGIAADGGPIQKSISASVGHGGEYTLPTLPYGYDALEPSIDAETMKLHHDKHHAAYVKGANDALAKLAEIRDGKADPAMLSDWTEKFAFNLSGHVLHSVFWAGLGPKSGKPEGTLATDIDKNFGSLDKLKAQFSAVATQVQGNGWGVLAYEPTARRLVVLQVRNHQLNVAWTAIPLLVLDVWEHAYYLKYKNVRADYVKAFWNVVNWDAVGQWHALVKKTHHGSDEHAH